MPNGCSNTATINYFDSTYTFSLNRTGNTWCYTVTAIGPGGPDVNAPGLSHFILELCPEITDDPSDSIFMSNITVTIDGQPVIPDYEINTFVIDDNDPNTTSIYGIKFDNGVEKGSTGVFCFTLNVNVAAVPGDLVVKGGNNDELLTPNAICTPGCNIVPTPGRGVYCSI